MSDPCGGMAHVTSSSPASLATLEQISRENLAVYRESPARLQEDVSQEAQVAHDYRGRLVYELLQNADDALLGASTRGDRALFRLTDEALWVANTGRALTESDVRGLCGLGASSKVFSEGPKRASIGHKGLGFKSVLEITDAPEAYSDTVCFRLGRDQAMALVQEMWALRDRGRVRAVPAMRFPSQIAEGKAEWEELQRAGFHSAFRFPFDARVTSDQRHTLATQLLTLPMTSVLFLKHLEEVVIEVDMTGQIGKREWLLERHRVTLSGVQPCVALVDSGLFRVDLINGDGDGDRYWVAHNADVAIGEHREGLTGPAWEGVDVSEVSVAVRDSEDPRLAPDDQRFHVFLPTQEPSGCSLLVNGAFTTDLSRQHVQVPESDTSYNGYLIREAARTFVDTLLPHLLQRDGARYVLRVLDRQGGHLGEAAEVLHRDLVRLLSDQPLLPSGERTLSLAQSALPTHLLGPLGHDFAELLRPDSLVDGRCFPDPEYCEASLGSVSAAYGAASLTASETLSTLAHCADPARATLRWEPARRFRLDPILELCTALWEAADAPERRALEAAAKQHPVFPIGENEDGGVNRITLGDETAFYPPQSSAERLPLRRLRFLAHTVCWGSLGRTEQRSVLERQMKAWGALFDIKEFRFEEVMRAAVLPGLTRAGSADTELRDANRSIEALATICRLAGKTTKPDQPLPLGRLGSDRAFFNLSRLEVPCRSHTDGETTWAPAHQVYFGRDWLGPDSVEDLADAMAEVGSPMDLKFLAPPEEFEPFASAIGVDVESDRGEPAARTAVDDGEVDLEDDTDEVLETTAADRWRNFFAWLGVSRGLRLVHFHDVDDAGTGWTSTKGMPLPGGWAFKGLEKSWAAYRTALAESLESDPRWNSTDHYLYQVHTLDRLDEIAAVAKVADNGVAERLLAHLVRNWAIYAKHVQAQVALVGAGKWPSSRTAPPRATSEELVTAGPDFWLFRLRNQAFCPTSRGPRRPDQTWRRSAELERRLGRGGRQAGDFLPVLLQPQDVAATSLRTCLDELQVRGELTPAAFTLDDAHALCVRIADVFADGVSNRALRDLRPLYRQLFELLVGSGSPSDGHLSQTPLAARTAQGIRFLPAREVVYASTSGSRERSGVQDKVPLFVLEAEPGALAPLQKFFDTPLLENDLDWSVAPGEASLTDDDLNQLRSGLRELLPPLLARLSADRAERYTQDRIELLEFVEKVEPVDSLTLGCTFRGEDLGEVPQRTFFVRRDQIRGFQGFIVWTGPAWPPIPEDAQTLAMAISETLRVNTVETFLSFINATPDQRRQLLELAGAAERLAEVESVQADPVAPEDARDPEEGDTPSVSYAPTNGESTDPETVLSHRLPPTAEKAAPRVPLHRFEDLLIDGEVIRVGGIVPGEPARDPVSRGPISPPVAAGSSPRAAAGTDLTELDRLGMHITIAFERRRLCRMTVAVLPGEPPAGADALIVDVSSPGMINAASEQSATVRAVLGRLSDHGISPVYPGFDILTIKGEDIDRMIELKSSGVDAQVQAMSWNEWKTAQSALADRFWLYLVGNLRSDLHNSTPFLRAVRDPFGTLAAAESEDVMRRRTVQLRVREFPAADQLTLEVRRSRPIDLR